MITESRVCNWLVCTRLWSWKYESRSGAQRLDMCSLATNRIQASVTTWGLSWLVSCPAHARLPARNGSGERSKILWAYSPKVVMTNEIVRSVVITYTFFTIVKFVHLHLSIHTFFERVGCKMFWSLLGYIGPKACASPRNLTWFTRPFLLVRRWGLGTRLHTAKTLGLLQPYF